jgi:sugar lactone lactonase YvrE
MVNMRLAGAFIAALIVSVCVSVQGDAGLNRGIGDGRLATDAIVTEPTGLAVDQNNLYIVESSAGRVRRVDLSTSIITTVAGGGKQCATDGMSDPKPGCLGYPQRVAADSRGNVYVTDQILEAVIKIGENPHSFSFVTKTGESAPADSPQKQRSKLEWPTGIASGPSGVLYFNDQTLSILFRLLISDGSLEIIAGTGERGAGVNGGPAEKAQFRFPDGLARDRKGNLFIADYENCRIQKVDLTTDVATTAAGTQDDGSTCEHLPVTAAILDKPQDVAIDQNGALFFVQPWRCRVRRVDPFTGAVITVAGSGQEGLTGDGGAATQAQLHFPMGIAVDSHGNLYIADTKNNRVRRVDSQTGLIATIAGHGPIQPDLIL